ncbi:MAG: hypothetical protein EHM40_03330 [Chloroflexi bacterium]|nr:MAG: hypothetical protein EHM40_03330 [Chloroflexota bacterium]
MNALTVTAPTSNRWTTNMASCNAQTADRYGPDPLRPVDKPLAWAGPDRILLDDVTCFGLHRWVIARKNECPDQVSWLLEAFKRAGNADVRWRMVWKDDGYWYLWIYWKE